MAANVVDDPASLGASLGLMLDEGGHWLQPLAQFHELLVGIVRSPIRELRYPYQSYSNEFLTQLFPIITGKVLNQGALHPRYEDCAARYLWTATDLCCQITIGEVPAPAFVTLLITILDPGQNFYANNGRVENQAYSSWLLGLGAELAKFGFPTKLLIPLARQTAIGDIANFAQLFERMAAIIPPDRLFVEPPLATEVFVAVIQRLTSEEDRKIPFKELLKIIPSFAAVCPVEPYYSAIVDTIMRFTEIKIADVQMAGIRLTTTFFTQILPDDWLERAEMAEVLAVNLRSATKFEALQVLKPVLLKFAERNLLGIALLRNLWENVTSQPSLLSEKATALFCDVVLKSPAIPELFELIQSPEKLDVYGGLIAGSQYAEAASNRLLEIGSPEAFDELSKAAAKSDLSFLIPAVSARLSTAEVLPRALTLLSAIFEKSPRDFATGDIAHVVATHIGELPVEATIPQLVTILRKTSTTLPTADFELLYKTCGNSQVFLMQQLFPDDHSPLIPPSSFQYLGEMISAQGRNPASFGVLEHLFLHCRSTPLQAVIRGCVWDVLLTDSPPDLRERASKLMLTISDNDLVIPHLTSCVEKCLDCLMKEENGNAALFITECLDYTATFVDVSTLGLTPHQFETPEDLREIKVDIEHTVHTFMANPTKTIGQFLTIVAGQMKRDVASMILYLGASAVKNEIELASVLTPASLFEVRFRRFYSRAPPFTVDSHPVSLIRNSKSVTRLFDLLESKISEQVYGVLIKIPTPDSFQLTSVQTLNPARPFLFTYQLHFLARTLEARPDKAEFQKVFARLLAENFDLIQPEARYLLVLCLETTTQDPSLLVSVLARLYQAPRARFFSRTVRRLWGLVSNFEIELSADVLAVLLSPTKPKFRPLALESKLLQSQKFEAIWAYFNSLEDKIGNVPLLLIAKIPPNLYEVVFNTLLPYFSSLTESLLSVFEQITENWADFPAGQLTPTLLDSYIKCTSKPHSITSAPFKLIRAIMKRSPATSEDVLATIQGTIPDTLEWNYRPENSFKSCRVGLTNLGATCYINAVLQQLFSIPQIRQFFLCTKFPDKPLTALHVLFNELEHSDRCAIDMHKFGASWTNWDGMPIDPKEQKDANEFFMLLFTRLEGYPEFTDLIAGETQVIIKGPDFENVIRAEKFSTLALAVMGRNSLRESFAVLAEPERIEDYRKDSNSEPVTVQSRQIVTKLPPFLILQLKRFDYSIETGRRTKLDQKYDFEDAIDVRPYVEPSITETEYSLIGVVVHQGDADAGHYLSYVRQSQEDWICLNDTGVNVVKTAVMRRDAVGETNGSSAYLLVYQRKGAETAELTIRGGPDAELTAEIGADNVRLIIDSVYFSKPFAGFMLDILRETGLTPVIYRYFTTILAHSSLSDSFSEFVSLLSLDGNIDLFTAMLQDDCTMVLTIMSKCTCKPIRLCFSEYLKTVFAKWPADCELFLVIATSLADWYPAIIQNWRTGLDFFKVIYDFATISADHKEAVISSYEIPPLLLNFVTDIIPKHVADKSNNITHERFARLVDLTWLLKCFALFECNPTLLLSRQCMRWFVGSETHPKALVEMIETLKPAAMATIATVIGQCDHPPSEHAVMALMHSEQFRFPPEWFQRFFSDGPKLKHLVQAFTDEVTRDPEFFTFLAKKQAPFLRDIAFPPAPDLRTDIVASLQKLSTKVEGFPHIIFDLFWQVPAVIHRGSHGHKQGGTDWTLPFLQFMRKYITEIPAAELAACIRPFADAIEQVLALKLKHNEEQLALVEIGSAIIRATAVTPQFIASIAGLLSKVPSDHPQIDSILRSYYIGVNATPSLTVDVYLPETELRIAIFAALLTTDHRLRNSRPLIVEMFNAVVPRFAGASRFLKLLAGEIPKYSSIDCPNLLQILAKCDKSAFASNAAKPLYANKRNLEVILSSFAALSPVDPLFGAALPAICRFVEAAGAALAAVLTENSAFLAPFCDLIKSEKASGEAKVAALKALQVAIPYAAADLEKLFGDFTVAAVFTGPEIDGFVEALFHVPLQDEDFALRLAQEFVAAISSAKKIGERPLILKSLEVVLNVELFVMMVGQLGGLEAILSLEPETGVDTTPYCKMAQTIIEARLASDRTGVLKAVEIWPEGRLQKFVLEKMSSWPES